MKVVVTGGAGFIGSHCVDLLIQAGHDVLVIDDFSSGTEANLTDARAAAKKTGRKIEILKDSIDRAGLWEKLEGADAFFHLAAQTSVTASVQAPDADFSTNVNCIPAIVKWMIRGKVRFLVYANTAGALYGEAATLPADERTAILPMSPYGATKSFFETYVGSIVRARKASMTWSNDVLAGDYFSYVSLRLANVYGPRQVPRGEAGVVPIFLETLAQGKAPTIFGDGTKVRDYVYVRDVARAFLAALDKLQLVALDDVFNVATGIETRDIEVFDTVLDALQGRARKELGASRCQKSLEIQEPNFAPVRPGEVKRSSLTNYKVQAFLNWKPEVSFVDGVQTTVTEYPLP